MHTHIPGQREASALRAPPASVAATRLNDAIEFPILYAIAQADGITSSEELDEIEAIAAEFGLTRDGGSEPD